MDSKDNTDRNRAPSQEEERNVTEKEKEKDSKDSVGRAKAGGTHSETAQVKGKDESTK